MSDISPLRQALDDAIAEADCRLSMKDLTVLAIQNDPFRIDTPAKHRDGEWLAMHLDRLAPNRAIHLRGVHYMLISAEVVKPNGQPYRNNDDDWTWLQDKAADAARWLGYVPFDRIVDQRNAAPVVRERTQLWTRTYLSVGIDVDIPDVDELEPRVGVIDFNAVQPYKLVLVGEKSSLEPVLGPVAQWRDADLYLPTGCMSDTLIHNIAKTGDADGRPMVVFYFADCDPAGWNMAIEVSRKLQAFKTLLYPDLDFEVRRVALTPDQVREYGLPSTPLKDTEKRADAWQAATGVEQTEIDALAALQPRLLRQLAENAIDPFYDSTLERRVNHARSEWREEAQEIVDNGVDPQVLASLQATAETKLRELRDEIDAINNAMRLDADDFDLPEIVIPEADVPGSNGRHYSIRRGRSLNSAPGSSRPRPTGTVAMAEMTAAEVFDELLDRTPVLDDVRDFLARFVAYPSPHALTAHVLWCAHAHLMDAWDSTPRIAFLSPEPGSGKTRALEVSELLVPSPVEAVNVTPAYLFRKVGECAPTILYDEIDTVFGPRAKDNEEIRGLLNAGHRRGAVAGRCVVRGKVVETEEIPAYCAVALAGLGGLPDTLLSRSVVVRMRRRAPSERVEQFRRRQHADQGHALRDRLAAWADAVREKVTGAWPDMPAGIEDRDADIWEALLAVADAAGGHWPQTARAAAAALVAESKNSTPSLGVHLLGDLHAVFGDAEALATETILDALHKLIESPWGDLRGKPLDARGLARRLRAYGIRPVKVWADDKSLQGYRRADLWDAWSRYLGHNEQTEGPEGTEGETSNPSPPSAPSASAGGEPTDESVEAEGRRLRETYTDEESV